MSDNKDLIHPCAHCGDAIRPSTWTSALQHYSTKHGYTVDNNLALRNYVKTAILTKEKTREFYECFVCGEEKLSLVDYERHLFEAHPYLGFDAKKFEDSVIKGRVVYKHGGMVQGASQNAGEKGPTIYSVKAGKYNQAQYFNWHSMDTGEAFLAIAKKALDW